MSSSRVCVKGVPPNCSEEAFRKHFSQIGNVTDLRLYPKRKLAYVGFQSSEDAAKAVSFFNKSFMGMARLNVDIAEPVRMILRNLLTMKYKFRTEKEIGNEPEKTKREESSLSKKRKRDEAQQNPKLQEFIETFRPSSGKTWANDDVLVEKSANIEPALAVAEDASDEEYQELTTSKIELKPVKKKKENTVPEPSKGTEPEALANEKPVEALSDTTGLSDAEWLRRRTNRVLEFDDVEKDEPDEQLKEEVASPEAEEDNMEAEPVFENTEPSTLDEISRTNRLFIRNLPYTATEEDLRSTFSAFGELLEVHIPLDNKSGGSKGFAHISFKDGTAAGQAYQELDGQPFQGRLLHVLPGAAKRDNKLDEFAISKLPLKKQKQIKRKASAASTFNWNSLYMNPDAVLSSIASRLGLSKSEILDPTSADAAVKQAHAETHVIQDTKAYFVSNGANIDAFQSRKRSDTIILIKNFPYGTTTDELRKMLEEFGPVRRLLMPPTGTIAIAEFVQLTQARAAFHSLAYRRFKDSILFLEKGPEDLFTSAPIQATQSVEAKPSSSELFDEAQIQSTTLFVRNLNFKTTNQRFAELFQPLPGFQSARIKTKPDPKSNGTLSMGFGFLEFETKAQANAALTAMNGYVLDGHPLVIKASHKGMDAAAERRAEDDARKVAAARTKIIIKNLPFEANKKDVRALFGPYGQLRAVRVPRKFDNTARGFAFADFVSSREAQNAMDALRDSHFLGRKLVLAFAAQDAADAETEIELMQAKVSRQTDKVALQKLVGTGRRKFTVNDDDLDPNGVPS